MAAPKGNTFNRGNPTGRGMRPRTEFTNEEVQQLGEEMLEWVSVNKPIHLSQWYSIEKMLTYNEFKTLSHYEDFIPYYQKALAIVGIKYLDGTVNSSISHRWQRVYFKDLREEEDETAKFNSDLKTKENNEKANLADLAISLTESIKKNYELKKEQDNK